MSSLKSFDCSHNTAVICKGVVKNFYHYTHRSKSLREYFIRKVLRHQSHTRKAESWVLIGNNGSGKSAALRLIAGIYKPATGIVETHGSLAAVIELGAGFNPELTGAENVLIYGAVMGLTRQEVARRFPDIVSFAEVGDFINEPVKYYSSGMKARLAFAVTVSVEPDILLIDEVFAVGDAGFRQRCLDRLHTFRQRGGTLIVVSHNHGTTRELCTKALWLEGGRPVMKGEVNEVVDAYLTSTRKENYGNQNS
jgi:lipopolysaccharide transport system ATP-binding protein